MCVCCVCGGGRGVGVVKYRPEGFQEWDQVGGSGEKKGGRAQP